MAIVTLEHVKACLRDEEAEAALRLILLLPKSASGSQSAELSYLEGQARLLRGEWTQAVWALREAVQQIDCLTQETQWKVRLALAEAQIYDDETALAEDALKTLLWDPSAPSEVRSRALYLIGEGAYMDNRLPQAATTFATARTSYREGGDSAGEFACVVRQCWCMLLGEDVADGGQLLQEAESWPDPHYELRVWLRTAHLRTLYHYLKRDYGSGWKAAHAGLDARSAGLPARLIGEIHAELLWLCGRIALVTGERHSAAALAGTARDRAVRMFLPPPLMRRVTALEVDVLAYRTLRWPWQRRAVAR